MRRRRRSIPARTVMLPTVAQGGEVRRTHRVLRPLAFFCARPFALAPRPLLVPSHELVRDHPACLGPDVQQMPSGSCAGVRRLIQHRMRCWRHRFLQVPLDRALWRETLDLPALGVVLPANSLLSEAPPRYRLEHSGAAAFPCSRRNLQLDARIS